MMKATAILDYVGFPIGDPETLECRFQLAIFKDGVWVDDGSRNGKQKMKHRVALNRSNLHHQVAAVSEHLSAMGYEVSDVENIASVADMYWSDERVDERYSIIERKKPCMLTFVRAVGFGLYGGGHVAIGLSRATIMPHGITVTQKANLLARSEDDANDIMAVIADEDGGYMHLPSDIDLVTSFASRSRLAAASPAAQISQSMWVPVDVGSAERMAVET